jgi:hypothetical protein
MENTISENLENIINFTKDIDFQLYIAEYKKDFEYYTDSEKILFAPSKKNGESYTLKELNQIFG